MRAKRSSWCSRPKGDADPQFVLHGNLCCETSNEDDEVAGKRFLDDRNEEAELAIQRSGNTLSGSMEFRGRDYDFNLTFSSEYTSALTLATLAGVYTQSIGASTMTLTIGRERRAHRLAHERLHVQRQRLGSRNRRATWLELSYDMSGCGGHQGSSRSWNGRYSGVGLLLPNTTMPGTPAQADVFYHSTVGPTWFGPQAVGR